MLERIAERHPQRQCRSICLALVPIASGDRLYFAVYVRPVSWITRPYLLAIEPFRRILYPAMLRRLRRAWIATYAA